MKYGIDKSLKVNIPLFLILTFWLIFISYGHHQKYIDQKMLARVVEW